MLSLLLIQRVHRQRQVRSIEHHARCTLVPRRVTCVLLFWMSDTSSRVWSASCSPAISSSRFFLISSYEGTFATHSPWSFSQYALRAASSVCTPERSELSSATPSSRDFASLALYFTSW